MLASCRRWRRRCWPGSWRSPIWRRGGWVIPAAASEVLEKLDSVVIGSAFAGDITGSLHGVRRANWCPGSRDRALIEAIGRRGADFVAQETVSLSTMPAWHEGKLVPRPFILRLMLARVGDGWRVMPGGFVRVADNADARAVSLQQGGRTADAWVLSDKPVARAHAAADARPDRDQPDNRRAAEPRRGQSVLARALCGAHRGDAAHRAGVAQPRDRERQVPPSISLRVSPRCSWPGVRCRLTC